MSNWTHVAGIIYGGGIDLNSDIYNDVPYGSEGRLNLEVWKNSDKNFIISHAISVFGDLRDHESAEEIIDWFKGLCNKFIIVRDAIIIARNERNGQAMWVYKEEQ